MAEALAQKTVYSREEYLEIEERAEYKSEYYNGEIFAMAGGSRNHSVICLNVNWGIREAISTKDCVGFESNMKLDIPKIRSFVYPDAMVVCGEIEFSEEREDCIKNPLLIVEVLSPSTEAFDRGRKFAYYRSIESLREYVMISQTEASVESFYKQNEKVWRYTVARGLDDRITL
ncbi:MAG: Uma2 family endonuclease, partial [bacterium]|nr:Uma2 family endonuclease [bacterium]